MRGTSSLEDEWAESLRMCQQQAGQRRLEGWSQMQLLAVLGNFCSYPCGVPLALLWVTTARIHSPAFV